MSVRFEAPQISVSPVKESYRITGRKIRFYVQFCEVHGQELSALLDHQNGTVDWTNAYGDPIDEAELPGPIRIAAVYS